MTVYKNAQPSDYPVLFYLGRLVAEPVTILDIGGSAGSLYYCYSRYVDLSHAKCWTVLELPFVAEFGRQLALERNECRLRFTSTLEGVDSDILLASGSLHYFESPLPDLVRELPHKPKHVIINRTPLSDLPSVVTVQDAGKFLVACRIHRREELIGGMEALNYELVDSWRVPDHSIQIPFYPEYSVPEYSGLYFRLKSTAESS
jgi:putative methyltransferase (TIGR04325 family)